LRVLVAGGVGYIGSVVAEELLRAGYEVIVFADRAAQQRAVVPAAATFVQGDLANQPALERLLTTHRGIRAVLHFPPDAGAAASWRHAEDYLRDNVTQGLNLIAAAVRHDIRRFLLASSANVFGGPLPVPIGETAPIFPSSPYGEALYLLERTLAWYERTADLRYGILRCFNVAGATDRYGEHPAPAGHLIPTALSVALGRRPQVPLFGADYLTPDGTCIRDYIHVRDVALAVIHTLGVLDQRSRIYNLGTGHGVSNKEVLRMAGQITGQVIPYVVEAPRPYEQIVSIAAPRQIREELGWTPQYSDLESIIGSAWAWQRCHPPGNQ
jgi:UDP-glucose 4-epimerase